MIYFILAFLLIVVLAILLWPVRRQRMFCAVVATCCAVGAFGIYYVVGAPEIIPMLAARDVRMAELTQSITENSQAVKTNPKKLDAWVALGADFMETGQYGAAANAFKQAVLLTNGNPVLILAYAKAMIAEADGKVSDAAKKSLQMVILQDPKNPDARYFLTVRKLQDGNNEEAMRDMKALYRELPDDSALKAQIDRQIGKSN